MHCIGIDVGNRPICRIQPSPKPQIFVARNLWGPRCSCLFVFCLKMVGGFFGHDYKMFFADACVFEKMEGATCSTRFWSLFGSPIDTSC